MRWQQIDRELSTVAMYYLRIRIYNWCIIDCSNYIVNAFGAFVDGVTIKIKLFIRLSATNLSIVNVSKNQTTEQPRRIKNDSDNLLSV